MYLTDSYCQNMVVTYGRVMLAPAVGCIKLHSSMKSREQV